MFETLENRLAVKAGARRFLNKPTTNPIETTTRADVTRNATINTRYAKMVNIS
jgi:hypothetical protein